MLNEETKQSILTKYPSISDFKVEDGTIIVCSELGYYNLELGLLADELLHLYNLNEDTYGLLLRREMG